MSWVEARAEERPSVEELREFLAERVPDYMIPCPDCTTLKRCRPRRAEDRSGCATGEQCVDAALDILNPWHLATTLNAACRPSGRKSSMSGQLEYGTSSLRWAVIRSVRRGCCSKSSANSVRIYRSPQCSRRQRLRVWRRRFAAIALMRHGSRLFRFSRMGHLRRCSWSAGFRRSHSWRGMLGEDQPLIGSTVPDKLKMRLPYDLAEFAAHQVDSILRVQKGRPLSSRRVQRRRHTCL